MTRNSVEPNNMSLDDLIDDIMFSDLKQLNVVFEWLD